MATAGTAPRTPWHLSPAVFDVLVMLAVTVWLLAEMTPYPAGFNPAALLMTVPLYWRRRYPLPVFGLILLGAIVSEPGQQILSGYFAIIVAAYSVGAYTRHRRLSLVIFLVTAVGIDVKFGGALPPLPNAVGPFVILVPFWVIGMVMQTRQLRAEAFESKAARLEREQEHATQMALTQERSRIARELHDVVAHSVSVMLVQAGAARQVLTSSPEEAREALLAVEASGRDAMTELRALVGLLKQSDGDADLAPQPGIGQIDGLIQRVCEAGLPVTLRMEGEQRPLPAGLDLTVYRVVQEALTNALKYSGLAPTEVVLDYRPGGMKVEILDQGNASSQPQEGAGPGRGLMGMRERIALYGGQLEAGPRLERGYAVRVWLPFDRGEA